MRTVWIHGHRCWLNHVQIVLSLNIVNLINNWLHHTVCSWWHHYVMEVQWSDDWLISMTVLISSRSLSTQSLLDRTHLCETFYDNQWNDVTISQNSHSRYDRRLVTLNPALQKILINPDIEYRTAPKKCRRPLVSKQLGQILENWAEIKGRRKQSLLTSGCKAWKIKLAKRLTLARS